MEIDDPDMNKSREEVACDSSVDSENEFVDLYIVPIVGRVLPSMSSRHFLDEPEGR
jgi:hypothetical protein